MSRPGLNTVLIRSNDAQRPFYIYGQRPFGYSKKHMIFKPTGQPAHNSKKSGKTGATVGPDSGRPSTDSG